jgi:bis(5'-nucleosidyl)-tetraphosphatase
MERRTLSSGAVVVRRDGPIWLFLILRAYRNWDLPKGMVEPGEDSFQAALRETREETGIVDLTFPWGMEFVETPPYSRGKVARFYLGETQTARVALDPSPSGVREHFEYRWLPYAEAHRTVGDRLRAVLEWAHGRMEAGAPPAQPV